MFHRVIIYGADVGICARKIIELLPVMRDRRDVFFFFWFQFSEFTHQLIVNIPNGKNGPFHFWENPFRHPHGQCPLDPVQHVLVHCALQSLFTVAPSFHESNKPMLLSVQ